MGYAGIEMDEHKFKSMIEKQLSMYLLLRIIHLFP